MQILFGPFRSLNRVCSCFCVCVWVCRRRWAMLLQSTYWYQVSTTSFFCASNKQGRETRRDFQTYERNKFCFKHVMERVIRIPRICHTFSRKFSSLLWRLKFKSPVGNSCVGILFPPPLSFKSTACKLRVAHDTFDFWIRMTATFPSKKKLSIQLF